MLWNFIRLALYWKLFTLKMSYDGVVPSIFMLRSEQKRFKIDSIPLPPSKAKHALSDALGHIKEVNLYASCNEQERYEELELVCLDGTYLCYFSENEDEALYAKIEKEGASFS